MPSDQELPFVSFVLPTLNAEATLRVCLASIFAQNYPLNRLEVLIVDGGSTDSTLEIAKQFPHRLLTNPYRFEEGPRGGKNIGQHNSAGEIVVFMDSDNELASREWLRRTITPYLLRRDVVGTFPHLVPASDGSRLARYLTMANPQPSIRFWKPQDVEILPPSNGSFQVIKLHAACDLSNGAAVRREILGTIGGYDYGIETTQRLIDAGHRTFAWPSDTDVFHHYVGVTLRSFVRKRISRLRRFKSWEDNGLRKYTTSVYQPRSREEYLQLVARVIKSLTFLTIPEAAWKGLRDREPAWMYHPIVAFLDTCLHLLLLRDLALRVARLPSRTGGTN